MGNQCCSTGGKQMQTIDAMDTRNLKKKRSTKKDTKPTNNYDSVISPQKNPT